MELDLGDMLAALEKHQQAMKARQLTNTKPLSFAGSQEVKFALANGVLIIQQISPVTVTWLSLKYFIDHKTSEMKTTDV